MSGRWQDHAACRNTPATVFYPLGHRDTSPYRRALDTALAYCEHCPVRTQCADQADQDGERWGVWAGVDRTHDWRRDGRRRQAS